MKKIIFLLALLASMAANAAVTVTPLSANYGATKTVTFRVSWEGTATDRAWVWVDYCSVAGTSPGTFAQAVISGATATAGSIDVATLNGRGFYVTASPSTVTATLSNATGKFNWCVYGSDAPPKVTVDEGTYTLYGTPPFILTAADGSTTQTVAATSIAASAVTITPVTLTDQTGCPGIFCPYTGSDLYIDGTHLCQQRTEGAKNWEAYIKDSRDNKLYRIVLMPDDNWWLAQNMKLASYNGGAVGSAISTCTEEDCGRSYKVAEAYASYASVTSGSTGIVQGICPSGWLLPIRETFKKLTDSISPTASTVCAALRPLNVSCNPKSDTYGWSSKKAVTNGSVRTTYAGFYTNDAGREDGFFTDQRPSDFSHVCGVFFIADAGENEPAVIRCFRQL